MNEHHVRNGLENFHGIVLLPPAVSVPSLRRALRLLIVVGHPSPNGLFVAERSIHTVSASPAHT